MVGSDTGNAAQSVEKVVLDPSNGKTVRVPRPPDVGSRSEPSLLSIAREAALAIAVQGA